MNAPIYTVKVCALQGCGRRILRSTYGTRARWEAARYCCNSCGRLGGGKVRWDRVMAHEVQEGEMMTFEEIAAVAGASRQCVQQCYELALAKLRKRMEDIR